MKQSFRRRASNIAAGIAVTAVATVAAPRAWAIDFEDVASSPYANGGTFNSGGFTATVYAPTDEVGINGAVFAQGSGCFITACPAATSETYYAAINDGGISFALVDGGSFLVNSFDAAFLSPRATYAPDPVARITLNGLVAANQSFVSVSFDLAGTDEFGAYSFKTYLLADSALAGMALSALSMNACLITTVGDCLWPADGQAQFALDNVSVAAVPEPQTWMLLGAGLLLVAPAVAGRRRASRRGTSYRTAGTAARLLC